MINAVCRLLVVGEFGCKLPVGMSVHLLVLDVSGKSRQSAVIMAGCRVILWDFKVRGAEST
jgi:hypothetical protein